ncbi:ComEA family DNA-binding protein [Nocardiopsis deserti]|uniref:ComEA family DNA-binding protein n=1 Tax=Nocardiopsis deserti TaxID=2605988 RepID=UPI001CC234A8|nr:ComEA family DNA-binding protein [Nocardiopsis deserti]
MTTQRRTRRHSPETDQQDRLRALTLDASPAARRLRARIPRSHAQPAPPPRGVPPIPSAPYAVTGTHTPYRPEASGGAPCPERIGRPETAPRRDPATGLRRPDASEDTATRPPAPRHRGGRTSGDRVDRSRGWPERHPDDLLGVTVPPDPSPAGSPSARGPSEENRAGRATVPAPRAVEGSRTGKATVPAPRTSGENRDGKAVVPAPRPSGEIRSAKAAGPVRRGTGENADERTAGSARRADAPEGASGPDAWSDPTGGRHRRPERPPSGYAEFVPEPPGSLLERLARRLPPRAALSRRAVVALAVLGALAVVLVLALYHRPTTVPAPEMVTRAAPVPATAAESDSVRETGTEAGETGAGAAGAAAPEEDLVVHVGGEVSDPGLYTLPSGSRVADAVEEAGGALPDADLDLLNLARPLVDGEQVLVGVPAPAGAGVPGSGPQGTGGLVDINRADRALLETLPGVGAVIADNIVSYREEHGPFRSVDDLVNVDRIGDKVLADLQPHVTVG